MPRGPRGRPPEPADSFAWTEASVGIVTGPPDPDKLESHLDGLRRGLDRVRADAREATDPDRRRMYARRIRSYRAEIRDLERDLEKLRAGDLEGTRWEGDADGLDPLTYWALGYHLDPDYEEDLEAPAEMVLTPGLPILVPNVPAGLPASEAEEREARGWRRIYRQWARILADGWRIHDPELRPALRRAAKEWKVKPEEVKARFAMAGLLEAMAAADQPREIRIGSGEGSVKVRDFDLEVTEVVPADQGVIGRLVWLAQEARRRAKAMLTTYDEALPEEEEHWPRDPDSGERKEFPADIPPPDAALLAEERSDPILLVAEAILKDAPEGQRRILLALAPTELGNLVDELSDSPLAPDDRVLLDTECESLAEVARALDLSPSTVSTQVKRFRDKHPRIDRLWTKGD